MSFARIQAYLGLDVSGFKSGLEHANHAAESFKKTLKAGDIKGGLKEAIGAGAIIEGFKKIIERAQEAREAAEKIGRTVDAGTASVARYGDAWDKLKSTIADAAVTGLGFITQAGEKLGEFATSAGEGRSAKEVHRTATIGEEAGRNADKLSTPEALEKAADRGKEKKKKIAEEQKKSAEELEKIHKEGSEAFEKNQFNALSLQEQITDLEKRRTEAYNKRGSGTKKERESARLDQYKIEAELADKRKEQEKQITEYYEKQAKAILDASAKEQKAYDVRAKKAYESAQKQVEAEKRVARAKRDLEREKTDFIAPSLADVAGGKRGAASMRQKAKGIARDESTARRLFDSGNKVSIFNSKTQRNEQVGSEFFQDRAAAARKSMKIQSSDQNPFSASEEALQDAGDELKTAAEDLKTAISEMKNIEIEYSDTDED